MKRREMRMYGMIGAGMAPDEECITSKGVAQEMDKCREMGCEALDIYLSSDGGNVMEGLAIYDQIRRAPCDVTMHVDGRAASIASAIAMAGKRLVMPRSALMMIHSPWMPAVGNAAQLRKTADDLDVLAGRMRDIYCEASGLSAQRVQKIMDEETWLSADEAKSLGFADEVTGAPGARAEIRSPVLDAYRNTPASLRSVAAEAALSRLETALMRQRLGEIARSASAAASGVNLGSRKTK